MCCTSQQKKEDRPIIRQKTRIKSNMDDQDLGDGDRTYYYGNYSQEPMRG
jgi:hypothetical protein